MVLFFKHKDHTAYIDKCKFEAVDAQGNRHLLEILGTGEQAVTEGPHKSGAMPVLGERPGTDRARAQPA